MAFDWRKLLKDKRAWAVAGIGGAGGLLLAMRANQKSGGSAAARAADPTGGLPIGAMEPSVYDSSLQDIWEGFNTTAGDLQGQIEEIRELLENDTPPSNTTPPPAAKPVVWRGTKVTRRQSLYGFAQGHGGTLGEIIAHNPWLKGKKGSYVVKPGQIIKVRPLQIGR